MNSTPQHLVPVIHRRPKTEASELARIKSSALDAARKAAKIAEVPLIDFVSQAVAELASSFVPTPRPSTPTSIQTPLPLTELRHRPAPKVLTIPEAKRLARKGGRP